MRHNDFERLLKTEDEQLKKLNGIVMKAIEEERLVRARALDEVQRFVRQQVPGEFHCVRRVTRTIRCHRHNFISQPHLLEIPP